ncbi:hypothetical protein [Chamaesiphon sp. OTE_20_metabat_361]|uniref:O-antigen ligase family protein n=1 Tax=Chamaesiphon sp. OTE_20_metabat_361 TaxID=2964689 RepID=UPI00286A71D8|nr:hypothetical protein [Chamaesiphon sp. OTE_20_metabat_361]
MNKTFIDQLISFLATPGGIIGVAVGILMLLKATSSRPTSWLMFSLCCFASSLNIINDGFVTSPPLLFPLQQIRASGRPLAIVLLILLVLLAIQTQGTWRRWVLPKPIKYLMFVQFVILFKTVVYGSVEFAFISAMTFGGIVFMLQRGPGQWLQDDENFYLAVRSIAVVGLIFVVANTYQYALNRYAITFVHSRFLGTTGNPQHAAVLLAATIPCLMFSIQSHPRWNFFKFLWLVTLLIVVYFLLLTGSRTGLLMGIVSILLFFRNNGGAWFRVILFIGISAALLLPFLEPDSLTTSSGIDSSVSARFASTENSRESAWFWMWNSFTNNILFGEPLRGDRMGYGENSWLSAAANLGLTGLIPMILMGWESIKLIWQLNQLGNRQRYYFFQTSVVIAGLGSMLVGSVFEAFLLGNITFSLLAFLIYLVMGGYLIEVDRVRTYYASVEPEYPDDVGLYQ